MSIVLRVEPMEPFSYLVPIRGEPGRREGLEDGQD